MIDTLFWGPEIIVEADRITPAQLPLRLSGFVALIDLERNAERLEDAASILARTVGVRVKQYGGLGSYATMSIRGSSSTQVQVYLDGVPLTDAYSGVANLADLSLGDIGRIEVYRGFSPTAFGASSIGGTVNLVSRAPEDWTEIGGIPRLEASLSFGSFDTRRFLLTIDTRAGRAGLHLHGGHMRSAGDFSFEDDNATPENPADDIEAVRLNNDFTRWNYSGRLTLDVPGCKSCSINYDAISREGGVPGIGASQSTAARFERERRLIYLKMQPRPVYSGRLRGDLTGIRAETSTSAYRRRTTGSSRTGATSA
jgi:outer membrane cobalamin receptor